MHPLLPNRSSASSSGLPWSFHCQPHPFPLTLARPPPRSKIQAHPTSSPPLSSTEFFVAAWTRLFHLDVAGRDKKLKPFAGGLCVFASVPVRFGTVEACRAKLVNQKTVRFGQVLGSGMMDSEPS